MMWLGSSYAYQGIQCSHFQGMDHKMSWRRRLEIVITWILDGRQPANLIMWYFDQPDSDGHAYAPGSDEVLKMIRKIDHFVGELQRELRRRGLDKRVNTIILSDHGMVAVPLRNIIKLEDFMTQGTYNIIGTSPVVQVVPKNGFENQILKQLSDAAALSGGKFKVYTNQNFPPRWHVNNENRLGRGIVTAVAKIEYAFNDLTKMATYLKKTRNVPRKR